MSSVSSVETVNAAATAIVSAETRVQPSTIQQKRRWGSCWNLNWCFGSCKNNKRIGHAVLVSEPAVQTSVAPVVENRNNSSASVVLPFIAPPSSPASFLPADALSSAIQSPKADVLSLGSLSVHAYPPPRTAPKFTIGPYAYETQLVSPPVFSTFTTEPSTANFTPPPEPVQMTTPPSPEVPFAELLSSSLARSGRRSEKDLKYSFSQYEFQPYQYPGSPGGHSKSPGSAISTSGTSSPFPDKVPKFIGYEHFTNYKWGSGVGSGSLTPNGWTGASTPNGAVSRLGSGTMTPNGWTGASTPNGGISRLGSGTLTPNRNLPESQVSELASVPKPDHELLVDDIIIDHRVSFELIGDDIPICIVREPVPSHDLGNLREVIGKGSNEENAATEKIDSFGKWRSSENPNEIHGTELDEQEEFQKNRTVSLGSSKEFNFNNAKGEVSDKSTIDCEWWTKEKVAGKESGHQDSWTFFPMLQPGVS